MRPKIEILDDQLINQMAAGEVIEQPASVVKELVENSIDAGSKKIRVDLVAGGRHLIRVADDGHGIPFEEIPLAFLRHATSKIRSFEDLFDVHSLGFRGEALASIASISKVTLQTAEGIFQIEGGKPLEHQKGHHEPGTSIEVRDLFFNVPVRKKFLAAPDRLTYEVTKLIKQISLAHPEVAFSLTSDQQHVLQFHPPREKTFLLQLKERMTLKEDWLSIDVEEEGCHLKGWILGPEHHRPNRTEETLVVNRRVVDPYLISLAIREGYGPSLPDHRHPLFVLHLDVPGSLIDVNVHPQKKEVRLRDKTRLHAFIVKAIEKTLYPLKEKFPEQEIYQQPLQFKWQPSAFLQPLPIEKEEEPTFFPPQRPHILHRLPGVIAFNPKSCPSLMTEEEEGIAILSLKRAYQKLLRKPDEKLSKQTLMLPPILTLNGLEEERLESLKESIDALGFELTLFGGKGYALQSIPASWEPNQAIDFIWKLLRGEKSEPFKETLYQRLLKEEEGEELLIALSKLPFPHLGVDQKPLIKLLKVADLLS